MFEKTRNKKNRFFVVLQSKELFIRKSKKNYCIQYSTHNTRNDIKSKMRLPTQKRYQIIATTLHVVVVVKNSSITVGVVFSGNAFEFPHFPWRFILFQPKNGILSVF